MGSDAKHEFFERQLGGIRSILLVRLLQDNQARRNNGGPRDSEDSQGLNQIGSDFEDNRDVAIFGAIGPQVEGRADENAQAQARWEEKPQGLDRRRVDGGIRDLDDCNGRPEH